MGGPDHDGPPRRWVGTAIGVAQNVALPVGSYLVLVACGWSEVWALAGSAGVSVLALGVDVARRRPVNALGLLVLLRFSLSLALAWVTGDPRVLLVKDGAITLAIASVALWSLTWRRPLIARIRRDLAPDPDDFDRGLEADRGRRRLHRRLTLGWALGLTAEATFSVVVALTAPVTVAVVVTNVTGPAVIVGLVAWTEWAARRHGSDRAHEGAGRSR